MAVATGDKTWTAPSRMQDFKEKLMSAYVIANYNITNPEAYKAYPRVVGPTIFNHGGEILVADYNSEQSEAGGADVTIVLRFPSKDKAKEWYNSDEYQEIVALRTENSEGFMNFVDEFKMPG
jgi:uncharacterized protein (DUF1330 family)